MTSSSVVHTFVSKNGVNIATKTHDGGATATKRPRNPVHKHEDPFMYYSHQETRMSALLLSNGNDENDGQVARESHERKTRISFELHPSLLLEDLLPVNGPGLPLGNDDTREDSVIENLQRILYGR
mmetsp:Transcript_12310/g.18886  ORF Transcript_12310/g.18886 Transcript_12310/m.18886 type:complete len:126 (-) Transcript_12310:9-386(-)